MPVTNQTVWEEYVRQNQDPYGKCCVDVAREVMRLLDEQPGEFDPYTLICTAYNNIEAGGLSGFMAGCVAQMVAECHTRGEEFRHKWNKDNQIGTEGDEANARGGVLNPAILTVKS